MKTTSAYIALVMELSWNIIHFYQIIILNASSVDCGARVTLRFRSFLRSQDPFPVRDPLPVGQIWGQIWGHVTCISQSEARDGAEFQDGGPHLHI